MQVRGELKMCVCYVYGYMMCVDIYEYVYGYITCGIYMIYMNAGSWRAEDVRQQPRLGLPARPGARDYCSS